MTGSVTLSGMPPVSKTISHYAFVTGEGTSPVCGVPSRPTRLLENEFLPEEEVRDWAAKAGLAWDKAYVADVADFMYQYPRLVPGTHYLLASTVLGYLIWLISGVAFTPLSVDVFRQGDPSIGLLCAFMAVLGTLVGIQGIGSEVRQVRRARRRWKGRSQPLR